MKEIIAILRRGRTRITKDRLAAQGFFAYTDQAVLGRGRQQGLRYLDEERGGAGSQLGMLFLPKRMMTLFVPEGEVDRVLQIIVEANRTGEIGDGKVFVSPVEDIVRIRTDERHTAALI